MLLLIRYDDDKTEIVAAVPQADIVSVWMSCCPGIVLLSEPKGCFLGSDFFSAAMNEGNLRCGKELPSDDGESSQMKGFQWEILGDEAADCLAMIAFWILRLGNRFDPDMSAETYLYEGVLQILDEGEARLYENDRKCWSFYLDDPRAEAAHSLSVRNLKPQWVENDPSSMT